MTELFSLNNLLNEYFISKFELDNFLTQFNVWMNNQNVSDRAIGAGDAYVVQSWWNPCCEVLLFLLFFFFFKFYPSRSSWPRVSTREGRGRPGNTGITHLPPTQVPSLPITIMIDESNIVQSMHASITFIILVVHAESGKGKCSTLFTDSVQWLSCPSWMDGTYCGCTAVIILNWRMFEAS